MMEEQTQRSRGNDRSPVSVVEEEVKEEEEEELPYFAYARRFKQPMTYEDIIKRAYGGSQGTLLETIQEAMDRERK